MFRHGSISVNEKQLIKIDKNTFFQAAEMARLYISLPPWRFYKLLKEMTQNTGVSEEIPSYGLAQMVAVQAHYDRLYAGMYRLVVFTEEGGYCPVYKGDRHRKYTLGIYKKNNEFFGIRRIHSFFNARKFCIDCEMCYDRAAKHRVSCAARCPLCCGIGPNYPCVPSENFICIACNCLFVSRDCYETHLYESCRFWQLRRK